MLHCLLLFCVETRYKYRAFVINMDCHMQRWRDTKQQLSLLNMFHIERVAAYDTRRWTVEQLMNLNFKGALDLDVRSLQAISNGYRVDHHELTSGSVGCFMSHVLAWKSFVDSTAADDEIAFIFEDDVRLPPFCNVNMLASTLTQIAHKNQWMTHCDILLLSRGKQQHKHFVHQIEDIEVAPVYAYFGNWAYMITKRSAGKLLEKVTVMDQQLDWKLSQLAKQGDINILGTNMPLFTTRNLKSSTQSCQHWNGKDDLYTLID